jgi:hypothetical protein
VGNLDGKFNQSVKALELINLKMVRIFIHVFVSCWNIRELMNTSEKLEGTIVLRFHQRKRVQRNTCTRKAFLFPSIYKIRDSVLEALSLDCCLDIQRHCNAGDCPGCSLYLILKPEFYI